MSNWTLRNIVNKFLGLKLNWKVSNNHNVAGREQQGLQKSDRGVGQSFLSEMTQLQGLKLVGLQTDRLG